MHSVYIDLLRLGLTIAWGAAAWMLWRSQWLTNSMTRNAFRWFGTSTATGWALFYLWFNAAVHAEWSLGMHGLLVRTLNYATATTFIVWGALSVSLCKERKQHGMDC